MKKFIVITLLLSIVFLLTKTEAFELPDEIQGLKIPKPTAEIKNFDIESLSLRDITFLFDVEIYNPYPFKLKLSTVKTTFFIEGKQLFQTSTDKLKIKAKGTEMTRLLLNLKYSDIINIIQDYQKKDSLKCLIDMTISIPLPASVQKIAKEVTFNFKFNKEIPTIKPEINIANFNVIKPTTQEIEEAIKRSARKNLNANAVADMFGAIIDGKNPAKVIDPADLDLKLKVNFDIVMKNKTKAELFFKDLNYNFNINASKLVDGYTKDIKNKQGEYTLSVNNEFSSKALGKSILKAFNDGKGEYSLTGFSMVKFPDKIKSEPLKLKFDEKGEFNLK
ncbi:MAG TPA: LEA type 2 family protein [Spirochaetota bacterium]|mgnify:FL=1|jgi:LEA14-like dessication related protein|nr:LEA type 2 family protein [Spirochaetota bacterium]HOK93432.1 LEA type 2 family protein [Spirochaetota bacterium]HOV09717.1 LEA type 2 family protein [Spirochaetota bacterium]HPP95626.1 LEA type 2 family protein [Spirochaetota bacterium]HPX90629.1 LEA type 2 family protein [Spirochaetota bacterium]